MTIKVVYETSNILYKKQFELNFISSFIILDLSNTFFVFQIKSKKLVSFI